MDLVGRSTVALCRLPDTMYDVYKQVGQPPTMFPSQDTDLSIFTFIKLLSFAIFSSSSLAGLVLFASTTLLQHIHHQPKHDHVFRIDISGCERPNGFRECTYDHGKACSLQRGQA